MNVFRAIKQRHSTRHFANEDIPNGLIEEIVSMGCWAPSPKNEQPWYFAIVPKPDCKKLACQLDFELDVMREQGRLAYNDWRGSKSSMKALSEASAAVFIVLNQDFSNRTQSNDVWSLNATDCEVGSLLSLGMCAQNILLAACAKGMGALCICDYYYVYETVARFLDEERPVVLCIAFGKENAITERAGRKAFGEVSEWRESKCGYPLLMPS